MIRGIVIILLFAGVASANIQLASIFSDHMVLQRGKAVPVWGRAKPGLKLLIEFNGQSKWCTADAEGNWEAMLDPMSVNAVSQDLWVVSPRSEEKIKLTDLLVGDVWLCGGQSNMKWNLGGTLQGQEIIESAAYPNLRLLKVPKRILSKPADSFDAQWSAATPENVGGFSAVGYLFGERIHQETGVPIGLIMCAEGSTSVECWVSNETLQNDLFAPAISKWKAVEALWDDLSIRKKYLHKSIKGPDTVNPSDARTYPGGCFNGMLTPLFPFACKGVVWYQGEANRFRGKQYRELFPAMVDEWRTRFEQDNLRFYVVQLPEIGKPKSTVGDSHVAELREAQTISSRNDQLMEMAVIIDSDQNGNIHPGNKQLPAERLAKIALARDYGKPVEYRGPVFQTLEIKGNKALVKFDHADGLMTAKRTTPTSLTIQAVDAPPSNFAIAGKDQVFHPAEAVIDGDTVMVRSDAVKKSVAVRYAWSDSPVGCNLYNKAGLPAEPFRSDEWPSLSADAVEGKVVIIQ